MPERSGTSPGQEITPGIRIRAWEALKTIKNNEKLKNFEIDEISHEMHSPVDFLCSGIARGPLPHAIGRTHASAWEI